MEATTSGYFKLLELPNELIFHIIQFLPDRKTLLAACLVNKLFHTYAEPLIRTQKIIRMIDDGETLSEDLAENPRRAAWISKLVFAYPEKQHVPGPSFFPQVAKMRNLQDLIVEATDFPPSKRNPRRDYPFEQEEISKIFQRASLVTAPSARLLPNLRTLELQFLYDNHNLSLNSAGLPIRETHVDLLRSHLHSTPLESLTFEQCDICLPALAAILSVPAALKNLCIHEPRHYHNPRGWAAANRRHYLEALSPQSHSLESFSLSLSDDLYRNALYNTPVDWSPFKSLTNLSIAPVNILLGPAADYHRPGPLPAAGTYPPNLTNLTVWDISVLDPGELPALIAQKQNLGLPKLSSITFELSTLDSYTQAIRWRHAMRPPTLRSLSAAISSFSSVAAKYGVNVTLEAVLRVSSHIPPYLYGETPARRFRMYDSEDRRREGERLSSWADIHRAALEREMGFGLEG
ncbi:MAG: hypothetical protein Q9227_007693 [Pyrenula ochraceoflavens]